MTRISFLVQLLLITSVLIMMGQLSTKHSIAQNEQSTLSGRVINQNGEPIVGLTLLLSNSKSKTDTKGRFILSNAPSSEVQLRFLEKNISIESIKIGKVMLYNNAYSPYVSFPFNITHGTSINNVEVVTRNLLNKRCRIVFKNGDPLTDVTLNVTTAFISLNRKYNSSFSRFIETNAEGYFEIPIYSYGVYTLSLNYRGLSAEIDPFLYTPGEPVTRVLTLNGNPADFSEPPPEPVQNERNRSQKVSDISGMWIINPLNGHAYKKIICNDRTDAQIQAEKENAYLVTVTNLHEQVWLEAAYGADNYWIGITDTAEEGKWMWENGEPVTYTNWGEFESEDSLGLNQPPAFLRFFGIKDEIERHEDEMRDFAIMTFSGSEHKIGKWKKVHSQGGRRVGRISMAIIEKEVK